MLRAALSVLALLVLVGLLSSEAGARVASPEVASVSPMTSALVIPRLRLRAEVGYDVNAGPAWWPDVARPGQGTTVAVAGHRTTHGGPFRHLDWLAVGDRIFFRHGQRWYRYVVTGTRVFSASNDHIADLRPNEWLLLSACTLPNRQPTSASWRLVVYARLDDGT
jgi:LPXTG-site transpeptidase (sortase) family protein